MSHLQSCDIHGCHHSGSCCQDQKCACHSCSCKCHHKESEQCDFAHQLIKMADDAWMELVKEKIKEQIIASNGKQLDKLAKLVSDANNLRWKEKLAEKKGEKDFKERLSDFFSK